MNIEWIFEGIGTELICLIIGSGIGGALGYKIGVNKNKIKQVQRAGDNAQQTQESSITYRGGNKNEDVLVNTSKIWQKQKAKDEVVQKQKGEKYV